MMVKFKLGIPVIATVQKVGNKSREEGIAFASKADDMAALSNFTIRRTMQSHWKVTASDIFQTARVIHRRK